MLAKESGGSTFDLPEEVLQVLPSDPFEQLDVARKITSIALSTRVSLLEDESSSLRAQLAEKDQQIADLYGQIDSLDASSSEASDKLLKVEQEKESLLKDNASLSNTVRKLQRDVAKLEVFRKTLMQSLQEDEDSSAGGPHIIAKPTPSEDEVTMPSRTSSMRSQFSDVGNSFAEDRDTDVAATRPGISHGFLLASQTSTPKLTPPGSPPSLSASVSPTRTSKPVSPRRHSVSFSTSRGMFDDRSSISSSDPGSHTGRTRVDGKEFFRQVRSRLSYEQFGAFLANVKELNSHKQTREETLRKAEEIFGPDNRDLYAIFEVKTTYQPGSPVPGLVTSEKPWRRPENIHDLASLGNEGKTDHEPPAEDFHEEEFVEFTEPRSVESMESAESEPTSSMASTSSDSESLQNSNANSVHWRGFFKLLKKGPGIHFQTIPPIAKPKLTRRKSKRIRDDMLPMSPALDVELCYLKSSWKNFSLHELQEATNNFSHDNLIGEGGYAEVYRGQLTSGKLVAIKRLTRGTPEEMTIDYLSELGIIAHVDHPNIAKLIGYGVEGGMHLVLQLSPHGSLASLLYGPKEKLTWGIRYKIAVGTAEGLGYLHEGCQRRIIHKDIKASNILLTEDFEAQISDFGLSKWLPDQWTHHTVNKVEGTFGYLPPEFFMHGIVDEKTDVYAFGVLLLELITGRQAVDSSQQSLVMWSKPLIKSNKLEQLIDPTLGDAYNFDQLERLIAAASMCINQSAANRPQMSQVVGILKGDLRSLEILKRSEKSQLQRTYSEEINDAEEYNSTKYLNDLSRQMEFLLDVEQEEEDQEEEEEQSNDVEQEQQSHDHVKKSSDDHLQQTNHV
ncbi:hypothetical protein CCACVL1_28358 [Corchorus capsularis]|uniref:non-specific serine/threonine protein kinase n=1 Tax=Corchorus capsularis TaxID=210143 RepID=A0A1R3G6U2_COCAP|nr:hypothetical protein CCACVL1_28358 [Corchorus capsularis]